MGTVLGIDIQKDIAILTDYLSKIVKIDFNSLINIRINGSLKLPLQTYTMLMMICGSSEKMKGKI